MSAATLDKATGLWTLFLEGGVQQTYQARVLACCDGAPSALATKLGIVSTPPQGSCSRAYVEPGTHKFKADGVVIYNKDMLPGKDITADVLIHFFYEKQLSSKGVHNK